MRAGVLERFWMVCAGRPRRVVVLGGALGTILAVLLAQMLWPEVRVLPRVLAGVPPATLIVVFLLALLCEYVDSSLGMGYGTTLTPLLLLLGFAPLQVVPCVLLSEIATGFSAACLHHRDGNIDFLRDREARLTALLLSVLSTVGALAAVMLAVHISKTLLTFVIGMIILGAGMVTLLTVNRRLRYRPAHIVVLGTVAAFNKGLSGGGYGPLVTTGQVVSGLAPKKAVAVTSLAESWTCVVGLAAYVAAGNSIFWALAVPMALGAMLSVPVATLTVKRAPEKLFRVGVGATTCILGLSALLKLL